MQLGEELERIQNISHIFSILIYPSCVANAWSVNQTDDGVSYGDRIYKAFLCSRIASRAITFVRTILAHANKFLDEILIWVIFVNVQCSKGAWDYTVQLIIIH